MKKYIMSFGIAALMLAPVLAEDAKPATPPPAATPATTPPAAAKPATPPAAPKKAASSATPKKKAGKKAVMKTPATTTQK